MIMTTGHVSQRKTALLRVLACRGLLVAALLHIFAQAVLAHSPVFPEENHSPEDAYPIQNPAKSWATYTSLEHPDQGDYYRFGAAGGDKIVLSLITADSPSQSGFLPSLALLVPGLADPGDLPTYVQVPPGYGATTVQGTDPGQATYEPFSPGWYYEVASLETTAPRDGTYYVVVFEQNHQTGNYGLPVGYVEEFTPLELIMIPYNLQQVYRWEGQKLSATLLPLLMVLVLGGGALLWSARQRSHPGGISRWLAALAGLAFLGSAAGTLYQMLLAFSVTGVAREAPLTLLFAGISVILGTTVLGYALRSNTALSLLGRIGLFAVGIVALFAWSGLYFGPALAVLAALSPPYGPGKEVS